MSHQSIGRISLHKPTATRRLDGPPKATDTQPLYAELERLAEFMPDNYLQIFCHRWGLRGHSPHLTRQTAVRFELKERTTDGMLERALWQVARHAHYHQLPAVRRMFGGDRATWIHRAWELGERWGDPTPQTSEATLWLAVAGMTIPEARSVVGQHLIDLGLRRSRRWPAPRTPQQRAEAARADVDRVLANVMWPKNSAMFDGLEDFSNQRPFQNWGPVRSGCFYSEKLERLVEFGSDLELRMFQSFEHDPRIVAYQEQPLTIPYVIDEQPREYTCDAVCQLQDGRVFFVEAKPKDTIGEFQQALKWGSLLRYAGLHGLGVYIGNPDHSVHDHRQRIPNPEKHAFVLGALADYGPIGGAECDSLKKLIGEDQLGVIATRERLDWRPGKHVRPAQGADAEEVRRVWALIDRHAPKPAERVEPRKVLLSKR